MCPILGNALLFQELIQRFCNIAIFPRTLDGLRTAVTQHHAPAGAKFVALGVAAKIVVIVENQNACVFPRALAEEIGGCQPADASANDDEVVTLIGIYRLSEGVRTFAVPQAMGKSKCSVVIAAHAHARGRVIVRRLFRSKFVEGCRREQRVCSNPPADQGSADTNGHAIQKIPARDFASHPEVFFLFLFTHRCPYRHSQSAIIACSRQLYIIQADFFTLNWWLNFQECWGPKVSYL